MKTSLAGIAWIVGFILNLSHQGAAEFLEDRCRSPTQGSGRASTGSGTWMVALRNRTAYLCAGSLIHKRFVLTAAECIDGQRTITAMLGVNEKSHPKYEVSVARVLIHRSYSRETGSNNIALVMLSQKVTYNETVQPICIILNAVRSDVEAFREFDTFDWETGTNRRGREALHWIRIQRHDRSYCGNGPDQSYICGGPSKPGDCGGAIGGPLSKYITINGRREIHPVQLGIVSSGQRPCEGYRSYVDVTSYTDWIKQIVRAFDTLAVDEVVPQPSQDPRPSEIKRQNQQNQQQRPESEEMLLYNDCGQMYLIANIFGPDFMAKGVMITHRFVLTTASGLPEDFTSLRVGVAGAETYQEVTILSVFKHHEEDIALVKLSRELDHEDRMKPICMPRKAISAESLSLLGVLDIDRTQMILSVKIMRLTVLEQLRCKANLGKSIELSQICVQNHPGLRQFFGIRGNALATQIVLPGKSDSIYALFGIVTYSSNGVHVITKVNPYTDWIVSVVSENFVGNTT